MKRTESEKEINESIKSYFKRWYEGYKIIDIQIIPSEYTDNVLCRILTLSNHCINKYLGEYDNITKRIVSMKFQDLYV